MIGARAAPLLASHVRTSLDDTVRRRVLSGLNTASRTKECLSGPAMGSPVTASHRKAEPVGETVIKRVPSWLKKDPGGGILGLVASDAVRLAKGGRPAKPVR